MLDKRRFNLLSIGKAMPRIIGEIVHSRARPFHRDNNRGTASATHARACHSTRVQVRAAHPAYLLWETAPLITFYFPVPVVVG